MKSVRAIRFLLLTKNNEKNTDTIKNNNVILSKRVSQIFSSNTYYLPTPNLKNVALLEQNLKKKGMKMSPQASGALKTLNRGRYLDIFKSVILPDSTVHSYIHYTFSYKEPLWWG